MTVSPWLWVGFHLLIFAVLALDLGVLNRKAHVVSLKEAAIWSVVWVTLALSFGAGIYFWQGAQPALEFFTGYVIEYSLSVDNIFVFIMLFGYFNVAPEHRHRVLFWGILGAIIMRGSLIVVGAALIERFHWILYIFGAFLVYTGFKMAFQKHDDEIDPEANPAIKFVKKFVPVSAKYDGEKFFTMENAKRVATPLLLVLVMVETTDLIFALDSIPAIFAITKEPFLVYTSNIMAILGLRSLYFLLSGVMGMFRFLKLGLAGILSFVGIKMLISGFYHIPIGLSLSIIGGILAISVVASLMIPENKAAEAE